MSTGGFPGPWGHGPTAGSPRKRSLWRLSAYVGTALGALVLTSALLLLVFGNALLNGYGKRRVERAFAHEHPRAVLRLGALGYSVSANRLVAQSVTLSASNTTLQVGRISLTGVRWARLFWGTRAPAEALAQVSLEATNLELEFGQEHYGIHCAHLRASAPASELVAEGVELRTLVADEEFFAAHAFRTTRFHVSVPGCRVSGLAYGELLRGKAYRASSIDLSRPYFDALVNCDQPVEPFVKSPLMVREALAAIPVPLQLGNLRITHGLLRYCERVVARADPGVLTFSSVNVFAEGIANRGGASAAIQVRAQGDLMETAALQVQMTIPIRSPDFSFHYSGSLAAMDLTRLDAFLEVTEHTRIKSGTAQEAAFDINVTAGRASGRVRAIYKHLDIAILNKQTGTTKGLGNHAVSFLANMFKIRNASAPDASGSMREGKVSYERKPADEFLQFAWFALRSGVLDVISH